MPLPPHSRGSTVRRVSAEYEDDEQIRITEGPFAGFTGEVYYADDDVIRVMVNVFIANFLLLPCSAINDPR